jgi:type 1 fimbria pilin
VALRHEDSIMKFTATVLALAIATAAPSAFAQSADLEITGKIYPGACTIELGGGGIIDLGRINVKDLKPEGANPLPPVELPVTVSCESEVRYALDGTDNTEESAHLLGGYGLGLTPDDEKIGQVILWFGDATADGVAAYKTVSTSNGQFWNDSTSMGRVLKPGDLMGFSAVEGVQTGPSPIKLLQASMRVDPFINGSSGLTIEDEVPVNGSVTIDLKYL